MQQIQALDFSGAFVFRLQQMKQISRSCVRVHRGIFVVREVDKAVDGVRDFGCRSCPAPLAVSLAESVIRSELSSGEP